MTTPPEQVSPESAQAALASLDAAGGPSIGQTGEDSLVAQVITRYPGADWLVVGPGDDAAVLDLATRFPGKLVLCTDTLVEGQDFRRDWSSARDVGVKTAAQNFADVAAMGAVPHALLVSLTTPASVPAAWARELADGLAQECTRAGAVVAGGDLSGGSELVITGTALGTLVTRDAVQRSGARPGDVVAIAGVSGRSAAGWALLRAGYGSASVGGSTSKLGSTSQLGAGSSAEPWIAAVAALIADHRRPRPPYSAGPAAALAGAGAMIDTSDGLVRDAERLAQASGVVLSLESAALQPDGDLLAVASLLGETDPFSWVLSGGEDHALLACFPPSATLPSSFRPIGTVLPRPSRRLSKTAFAHPDSPGSSGSGAGEPADDDVTGAVLDDAVLVDGQPVCGSSGWRHFA